MGSKQSGEVEEDEEEPPQPVLAAPWPRQLALLMKDCPPFLYNLTRGELERRDRLFAEAFPHHHRCCGGVRDERREVDHHHRTMIDYVTRALRHYNANNPGAEFDPCKGLMYSTVAFRRALWVHVSFVARPRSTHTQSSSSSSATGPAEPPPVAADDASDDDVKGAAARNKRRSHRKRNKKAPVCPDKLFFAELRYDDYDSATVTTCRIIDKTAPHGFRPKCEFCPASFGILHPGDGKFACGKRQQRFEFYRLDNRRWQPYVWPQKEAEQQEP